MSAELNLTKEETAALDRVEAELGPSSRGMAKATALDLGNLCEKYQSLRPTLLILVKIVKKIPGIGGKIGAALEFLMSVADIACPA